MPKVSVIQAQPPTKEVPTEVLAASIVAISDSMKKLRAGRLTDRALYLLIQDAAPTLQGRPPKKISMKEIKAVFAGIESLESTFVKRAPAKAVR
jgi:hypothetical protein